MKLRVSESFLQEHNMTMATAFTEKYNCPTKELIAAANWDSEEIWHHRIREVWFRSAQNSRIQSNQTFQDFFIRKKLLDFQIQGAVIVASLFEVFVGATGLVGMVLSKVTPLTIVPTIALVGLSLFREAADLAGQEWGVSLM